MKSGNERGRRSQEEILEAASRLMAERGYAATTMSVLAGETGLPKSAIYHHFSSKAGLLSAVMERGARDFFEAMRRAHAQPPSGGSPRERMEWYLQGVGQVFASRSDFLRLHMLLVLSAEAEEAEVAVKIEQVRTAGRAYMAEMIAAAFASVGEEIARVVASELDYFGIAGFDGCFIAIQADPACSMVSQMSLLAEAIAALGEEKVARLRNDAGTGGRTRKRRLRD